MYQRSGSDVVSRRLTGMFGITALSSYGVQGPARLGSYQDKVGTLELSSDQMVWRGIGEDFHGLTLWICSFESIWYFTPGWFRGSNSKVYRSSYMRTTWLDR